MVSFLWDVNFWRRGRKPHCITRTSALHDFFFVGHKFFKTRKKTALLLDWKPHCIRRTSGLHDFFFTGREFLKTRKKTTLLLDWKPHCIGRASGLHGFFFCGTWIFEDEEVIRASSERKRTTWSELLKQDFSNVFELRDKARELHWFFNS